MDHDCLRKYVFNHNTNNVKANNQNKSTNIIYGMPYIFFYNNSKKRLALVI